MTCVIAKLVKSVVSFSEKNWKTDCLFINKQNEIFSGIV